MSTNRLELIRDLVADCVISNNEEVLVQLIYTLETEYKEIAKLSTFGEYSDSWTHNQVMDYITFET